MDIQPFDWKNQPFPLIAVDEVGRGCLAGPVVAAAVLVESPDCGFDPRITDSKKLNAKIRLELSSQIQSVCRTAIGLCSPQEIDEINIFQASFLAMKRAIENLKVQSGLVLVDGKFKIPNLNGFKQLTLIKGDLRAQPIGAASIVAKVFRDQQMIEFSKHHPGYGFEVHKGYATKIHKEAIEKIGICAIHRRSFRGAKEIGL